MLILQAGCQKNKIYSYYHNADLLIIPSRWEGLAMVPLEAFSCKLPVITSSCTSFPEIIKDRYNGFLVDMDNTEVVIQLLNEISADKNIDFLESLASNAYATYVENSLQQNEWRCIQFISKEQTVRWFKLMK